MRETAHHDGWLILQQQNNNMRCIHMQGVVSDWEGNGVQYIIHL